MSNVDLKTQPIVCKPKHPSKPTIHIFIAGVGAVGGTLIQQIEALEHPQIHVHLLGLCNSKKVSWLPESLDIESELSSIALPTNWEHIVDVLISKQLNNLVFVDATGSEVVAKQYAKLLEHGIHIATPSKRANTFDQAYFETLFSLNKDKVAHYKYETAVGAGLPVINTITDLIESGDRVSKISGVVSGTMTYIFNQLQQGVPFSQVVYNAKSEGYSEPDPRDDLSGEDVARKFLILARTCGYQLERKDIAVVTLVPKGLDQLDLDDFFKELKQFDTHWKNRNAKALVNNKRLRYTGVFEEGKIHVGIEEVQADSPFGGLKGTDNLIQIFTQRYAHSPIVIQGPGAGKEVTAAGVLSNIIEIALQILK